MEEFIAPKDELRIEIAMCAARLIAEEGLDYATARNQAIKTLLGKQRVPRERLPSDQEIQDEVRAYQALFQAESQPGELDFRCLPRQFPVELLQRFPQREDAVRHGGDLVGGQVGDGIRRP